MISKIEKRVKMKQSLYQASMSMMEEVPHPDITMMKIEENTEDKQRKSQSIIIMGNIQI